MEDSGYLENPTNSINASCDLTGKNITVGIAATAFTVSFLTILGNALVVIAIAVDPYKELRTIPNYLILNLAVCDLFVGPSEVLLGLLHFYPDSSHLYLVAYTAIYFSMVASALTILTLAFERYIVVAAPLQSKEYLIYSHLKLAIVYIWLIAGCVASLSLLNKCHEAEYQLIVADAIGIPTMLFMIVIYLRIFCLVRRFIRRDLEDSVGSEQQSLLRSYDQLAEGIRKREKEVAYSVFLFVGVFFLCWAPCFIMENVIYLDKNPGRLLAVADWVRFLGMLNSLLNPLIYAFRYAKFRKATVAILFSSIYRLKNVTLL
ncbi:beta-2 adrenergic receptor-like [Oculina patagonica]